MFLTNSLQPFSWQAGALFTVTAVGLYYHFTTEKAKLLEEKRAFLSCMLTRRPVAVTKPRSRPRVGYRELWQCQNRRTILSGNP